MSRDFLSAVRFRDSDEHEELARAEVYGLLAHLFYAPPGDELHSQLRVAVTEAPVRGAFLERPWGEVVAASRRLEAAAVADEYADLFLGVGKPEVFLYGSFYVAGSLNAKSSLGFELIEGTNLPQDLDRGIQLTREAADEGDATGMNNLGWAFMRGLGVPLDWDEARVWIEKAVAANDSHAKGNLAELYERGVAGLPQDVDKAKELYAAAAAGGDAWAQEQLDRIARGEPPEAVE